MFSIFCAYNKKEHLASLSCVDFSKLNWKPFSLQEKIVSNDVMKTSVKHFVFFFENIRLCLAEIYPDQSSFLFLCSVFFF